MPKIEIDRASFYGLLGKTLKEEELLQLLPAAKAELDGVDEENNVLKIELNDTNRPDLWSAPGLARQLRVYLGGDAPQYPFFSTSAAEQEAGERIVTVDPGLESIRPYIAAFAVTGKPLDDGALREVIQSQEKICWNYGQKRKSIAMGVYRSELIKYPVRYTAADPETTRFVPLDFDRELNLREINRLHPKGKDYGHIVEDFPAFPFLTDDEGEVLSYPPVINSARIGAVEIGDENLFIELTGTDIYSLNHAASIIACDLADSGYTILPVKTVYPFNTPLGREVVSPFYFQTPVEADLDYARRQLGIDITPGEAEALLKKMGISASADTQKVTADPPVYRNDFLHAADVVEDIMIGRGMDSFLPEMPRDFTVGRLTKETEFGRKVKDIMVGLGFQEMSYNYLGSRKDFIEKMELSDSAAIIKIANPMSENFEYVRPSILPHLLYSESVSGNAVYPHNIFEVGKIAIPEESDNYGSLTKNYLGFLSADNSAGFTIVSSQLSAVFFYLSRDYSLLGADDPRFIPGRAAHIRWSEQNIGIMGEVHPRLLENWGIQMPVTLCEIDLDLLL